MNAPPSREIVEEMLNHISAGLSREQWNSVGMICRWFDARNAALENGEAWGFDVWLEWSKTDADKFSKTNEADMRGLYEGFKCDLKSKQQIGYPTLKKLFKLNHPQAYQHFYGGDPTGTKKKIMGTKSKRIHAHETLEIVKNFYELNISSAETSDLLSDSETNEMFMYDEATGYWEPQGKAMKDWLAYKFVDIIDVILHKWLPDEDTKLLVAKQNKEEALEAALQSGIKSLEQVHTNLSNAANMEAYNQFIRGSSASHAINLIDNKDNGAGSTAMLLPFRNGVFDLTTCEFRPVVRTDYLSAHLNYDYPIYLKEDIKGGFGPKFWGKLKKMIFKFLTSMTGDDEEEGGKYEGNGDYLLQWLASTLPAKNTFSE